MPEVPKCPNCGKPLYDISVLVALKCEWMEGTDTWRITDKDLFVNPIICSECDTQIPNFSIAEHGIIWVENLVALKKEI